MDDIRLKVGFRDNAKIMGLEEELGEGAVLSLLTFWCWVSINRPDGVLSGLKKEHIELHARWRGNAMSFFCAMLSRNFVTEKEGVFIVHDWKEHQPYCFHKEIRVARAKRAASERWNKRDASSNAGSNATSIKRCDAKSNAPAPAPVPVPDPVPAPLATTIVSAKEDDSEFERFYAAYPRKVKRLLAKKAFKAALKITTTENIMAGLEVYRRTAANMETRYILHPASWLNAGAWDDGKDPARDAAIERQRAEEIERQAREARAELKRMGITEIPT